MIIEIIGLLSMWFKLAIIDLKDTNLNNKLISQCHNGFPLDLEDHKNQNGVATDLFCMGVVGHSGHVLLN